jgi:hypothetical protein
MSHKPADRLTWFTTGDLIAEGGLSAQAEGGGTATSHMMRTPPTVSMGHAFGVSDERVRSTRRRYAETWPIFCSKAQIRGR